MDSNPKSDAASRHRPSLDRIVRAPLDFIAILAAAVVVILPFADLISARLFYKPIPQAGTFVDHAILVLAFVAAALASLDKRHLALGRVEGEGRTKDEGTFRLILESIAETLSTTTQAALFWASLSLVFIGFDPGNSIWGIPIRVYAAVIPLGFLLMSAFSVARAGSGRHVVLSRTAAILGLLFGSILASSSIANFSNAVFATSPALISSLAASVGPLVHAWILPLLLLYLVAAAFGAPIFTILGGVATLLYIASGGVIENAPSEAYRLLLGGSISALPLFGLAGLILAGSGAGNRLVAVFREFFGWVRGGEAIATVLACAFFSTFTGVNGVTILALGGLLLTILSQSGMNEGRARGLITSSGDIGLLLPPSAAIIVYAVNAQFSYKDGQGFDVTQLFIGAILPGLLLVAGMAAAGILLSPGRKSGYERKTFNAKRAFGALKPAFLELLVPLFAVLLFFTGLASLREIAAFSVLYIVIVEALVKREFDLKTLIGVLRKAMPVIGGTLIVIAAARGLSYYVIDSDITTTFAAWIQARVTSPIVFLLALNVFLLLVGCIMDLYSAILVVSPFVIPLGIAFGVNPVHLGVIFIMNLCIGFLTPTVGMNIFLASYAFRKPVMTIVKETLPFLGVQAIVLLVITYVPWLSTGILGLLGRL
ncbi:MAG TPA: TRAP transporter large permease [Rectinemataceae bacterium]|nr:TRAP transporter large permease [Rectinemataceae bacterium]